MPARGRREFWSKDVLGSSVKGSSSVALSRSTSSTTSWRCETGSSASSPLLAVVSSIEFMPPTCEGRRAVAHRDQGRYEYISKVNTTFWESFDRRGNYAEDPA